MNFTNNTEKYSFLKGDWPKVEVSADGNIITPNKTGVLKFCFMI